MKKTLIVLIVFFSALPFQVVGQNYSYADSNGVKIYYREFGRGVQTIAVLNGGPGISSEALMPIVDSLKINYKVILIDQRGTGKSLLKKVDSTSITLENYIEDINAVRKSLGLDKWIVLGHSFGGALAMAVTARYPENVSNLILIGSMGIDQESSLLARDNLKYSIEEERNWAFWNKQENKIKNRERADYELYRTILPSRLYNSSDKRKILAAWKYEPHRTRIASLMIKDLNKIKYDFKSELNQYNKPVFIIQGRQGFMGGAVVEKTHKNIPKSQVYYIERCGHFPFVEQPEIFYKILKEILYKIDF